MALFSAVLLPWPLRRVLYRRLLGWQIHPTAHIGRSFVDVVMLKMGPRSSIGHFNVLRNLGLVRLNEGALIGHWNWLTADVRLSRHRGTVEMGRESAITSRHYVDGSGNVRIGRFTTIAGIRSTILSHQIDVRDATQSASPVVIGEYCLVSSNVGLVPGTSIPDRSLVAMGAIVVGQLTNEGVLYAGVPAREVSGRTYDGAYFRRPRAQVNYRQPAATADDIPSGHD